jgi:hypothetical protein
MSMQIREESEKTRVNQTSSLSITEFHVLVAQARAEAANPALKVWEPIYSPFSSACEE